MLSQSLLFQPFQQRDIRIKFNLLVEALQRAGYKNFKKLNQGGSCNGLSFCYALYVVYGKREEFLTCLSFISLLNEKDITRLVERYQKNPALSVSPGEGLPSIRFAKVLELLETVHLTQKNYSMNEQLGSHWDKTLTFICPKDQLENKLKIIQTGETIFISLGTHIFYIEKTKNGFYLFEPNNINKFALHPLLKTEKELAEEIIKNCKWCTKKDNMLAFSMRFFLMAIQNVN
jgi:hypothetical protein